MKTLACTFFILITLTSAINASPADYAGVIRVFGDTSSWMSSCFVVGDGSWVVASADAILEPVGKDADRVIRYPIFISLYTGQAYQATLKAYDKLLNVALLKLPASGLPAVPFAQVSEFSKAAYGTYGQLISGEPVGNSWPTSIYGIARRTIEGKPKLVIEEWQAGKVFVTDIDKYRWVFLSEINPDSNLPDGSMVMRNSNLVGMFLNKLTINAGKNSVTFGRCAMSSEIARFLSKHGIDTSTLYSPPPAKQKRGKNADEAFQLFVKIYSFVSVGRPEMALEDASELVKIRPDDAHAKMLQGLALMGSGKLEDALKVFDEALKIDSKLPNLRTSRAMVLTKLNKLDEAEAELKKAVEDAPDDPRPITALANFYMGKESTYSKALEYAKKAASMSSDSPAAYLLVARAEKRLKDYKAAVGSIEKALKLAPDWPDALFALGSTYEEAGEIEGAEKAYRTFVEKQPGNPASLITLASFLIDHGKKDEAREYINKIRDLNPPQDILDAAKELEDKINGKDNSNKTEEENK